MHVVKGRLKNLDGITTCPWQWSRSSGGNGTDGAQAAKHRTHSPHTLSSRAFHFRFACVASRYVDLYGGGMTKMQKKMVVCLFDEVGQKEKRRWLLLCA